MPNPTGPMDPCIQNNTCTNPACQQKAMLLHFITEEQHRLITTLYFGVNNIQMPMEYDAKTVAGIVNAAGVDCTYYINFGQPNMQSMTNTDIALQVTQLPNPVPNPLPTMTYSMFLFNGILTQLQPVSFSFSKAITLTPGDPSAPVQATICFSTLLANGVTMHWDVNMPPTML